jgi:hypothetical protein
MKLKKVFSFMVAAVLLLLAGFLAEATVYVSKANGNNQNPGSKASPVKEIDKAITLAQAGDTICIAGGIYAGTFSIGFMQTDKPLKLLGSFDETFSVRSIAKTPTVFQPDNESGAKARKAFLKFSKALAGTVVDGIVFDMGYRNAYSTRDGLGKGLETGRLLRATERPPVGNSTVEEPIIQVVSAAQGGDLTIQNCVFANGASFAIQAGHRQGTIRILNNVFVGNRMAAIEIFGTCAGRGGPGTMVECGNVEIAYNTILFSWSRLKDLADMGYGVRVMTKCRYHIHHNVIAGSVLAGIDHSRFNKDEWLRITDNIFFANKKADLQYSPASNTKLNLFVEQFGDLSFDQVKGNKGEIPAKLPVNKNYLDAFLSASYSEQVDFKPDSAANRWREALGLNKQGKITSRVSMFMNRYPWRETLPLFGALKGYGAQTFK